ncbi:MAG: Xaa-Pro peptidase family protein [Gemmatales bacterium]
MLTLEGCRSRRERLWKALPTKPDALLIADPQHLYYFCGYTQSPFVFRSNDAGAVLLLTADGKAIIIADSMSRGFCEASFMDEVVAPTWYDGKHSAPHREVLLVKSVLERVKKTGAKSIGLEYSQVSAGVMAGLSGVALSNIDDVMPGLKRRKDADEIAALKLSMKAGEAGMAAGLEKIQPGMSELDIYLLVQGAAMHASNGQAVVYGDFVTGSRTENVGGPPSDRKVAAGELVLLDFSTIIGQYRADFANTHVCAGKPTPQQRDMYLACMEAIEAGEKKLKAGVLAKDVDRAVREVFERKHLNEFFPHHVGHGIGLGHPEPPFLVPESSDTLLAGDVLTLEPGLYRKGIGGMRFERNYLITETGYELLSKHRLTLEV